MADLEDAGLLYAPHTSAGRLPTERGLRLFVDGLLEFGALGEEEMGAIAARCAASGRSLQETLGEAGQMLSGLAGAAGLVVAPTAEGALRHIEFVALGPGRALVVLVHEDGQVENRVIEVPPGLPLSALQQASNYLNARLAGRTIEEARAIIAGEIAANRTALEALTQQVIEAGLGTRTVAQGGSLIVRGRRGCWRISTRRRGSARSAGCSSGWSSRRRCCACWNWPSAPRGCRSSSAPRAGCSTAPACPSWWRPSATGRRGSSAPSASSGRRASTTARSSRWWTTRRG